VSATISLTAKLSRLRRHLTWMIVMTGVARWALLLVGIVVATFLLDYGFWLSPSGRLTLLILSAGGLLAGLVCWAWRPMRIPLSDASLALLVEDRFPQLRERLISAVQLGGDPKGSSAGLVAALQTDAGDAASGLDFSAVTRSQRVKGLAVLAHVAVLGLVAVGVLWPTISRIYLRRILTPFSGARWPRRANLSVQGLEPVTRVPRGSSLTVTVTARRSTRRGRLHSWRAARRETIRRLEADPKKALTFTTRFVRIVEPFQFYVTDGGDRTPTYEIIPVAAPEVRSLRLTCVYPNYTRLPEKQLPAGETRLTAVVGTDVRWTARATKPILPGGAVELLDASGGVVRSEPITLAPDRRSLRGHFRLTPGLSGYRFAIQDGNKFGSDPSRIYRLKVLADETPTVRLEIQDRPIRTGWDLDVLPSAILPLRVRSEDDYGIHAVRLRYRTDPKGKFAAVTFADTDRGRPQVENRYDWNLAPLTLKEDQVVSFYAEAEDYFTPPQVGESARYRLRVVGLAHLQRRLDDTRHRLATRLKAIIRDQQANQADVQTLKAKASSGPKGLERRDLTRLDGAQSDQRQLAARTARVQAELTTLLTDMQINRLDQTPVAQQLARVRTDLKDLAKRQMPDAADLIRATPALATPAQQAKQLETAAAQQGHILRDLRMALERLEQQSALTELIRQAAALVLKQKGILKDTRVLARQLLGQPVDEITPKDRGSLERLAQMQRNARDDLDSLVSGLRRTAKQVAPSHPSTATTLKKAAGDTERAGLKGQMTTAADTLQRRRPFGAVQPQAQAYRGLQKLLQALQQLQAPVAAEAEQFGNELNRMIRRLEQLIREQEKQIEQTKQAGGLSTNLQQLRRQISKLAEQQARLARDTAAAEKAKQPLAPIAPAQQGLVEPSRALSKALQEAAREQSPHAAQAAKAASQEASRATQAMSRAAQALARNEATTSKAEQRRALEHLKKAAEQLDVQSRPKAPRSKFQDMAREQARTRRQTDALRRQTDALSRQPLAKQSKASAPLQQAAEHLLRAAERMDRAQSSLKQGKPSEARGKQQNARSELQQARESLEEARQQAQDPERQKKLFDLSERLKAMLALQRQASADTRAVAERRRGQPLAERDRPLLHKAARTQASLRPRAQEVVEKLADENVPSFLWTMTEAFGMIDQVTRQLEAEETGWSTQQTQRDIETNLAEMIRSLEEQIQANRRGQGGNGRRGGGRGGSRGKGKAPLVAPVAQVRLLRRLQIHINDATRRYDQERKLELINPQLIQARVKALSERQALIARMADEIAKQTEPPPEEKP